MFKICFRLLKYMSKSGALDRAVRGHDYLESLVANILLEPDMTPPLPNYNPSVSAKGIDDFAIG